AAGNVEINASELIDNSVIRNHYSYVNPGDKTLDTGVGSNVSTPIPLNPQLPPDLAQQAVNPISLPGFQLPQGGNGLFHFSPPGQAYLIETNPALTGMKSFLGSDYLLGLLGY
ncbi:hypothetical protein, partial [Pseudomonas citronellolis]|uniref:hypothetical protein n=1 Tax=Pseudomonas citronellolis TaxID=53408 RepID=UPI0023E40B04